MGKYYGFGYRHYRQCLSVVEQKAYDCLEYGLLRKDKLITLNGITSDQVNKIYNIFRYDVPLVFYVKKLTYRCSLTSKLVEVKPDYRFDQQKIDDTFLALIGKLESVKKACDNLCDLRKELLIHDYFCGNDYYDLSFKDSSFECVGPLLFGKGVCEGISKASKLLFDYVGMKSIVVSGNSTSELNAGGSNTSHAWNIVNVDGKFYHLDITFDLTVKDDKCIRYDYFNLTNDEITDDHAYQIKEFPNCCTVGSYYYQKGVVFNNYDLFYNYLVNMLKGKQKLVVVQFSKSIKVNITSQKVLQIADRALVVSKSSFRNINMTYNSAQAVYQIHFE